MIEFNKNWNIIPIKSGYSDPKENKKPLIDWLPYKEKKFPREQLQYYKTINHAVICGKTSNNLVIIDFDFEGKPYFEKIIKNLRINFPEVKDTLICTTPHGLHIYLYIDGEVPPRKTQLKSPFSEIKAIDILGEGGYALVPPSMNDGGYYMAISDVEPTIIPREYFDKIVQFFSVQKEETKILETARKVERGINLRKYRKPFRDILNGEIQIHEIADETGQDKFTYWAYTFYEGLNRDPRTKRPEQLYPLLKENQKTFNQEVWDVQKNHLDFSKRPMTRTKLKIYFPDYDLEDPIADWAIVAEELMDDFVIMAMSDTEQLMIRKGNMYTHNIDDYKSKKAELLREYTFLQSFSHKAKEIDNYIAHVNRFDRDNFCYDDWTINFKNGYYKIKSSTFVPHSKNENKIFCYELPHEYKKGKYDCPKFKQYLKEWLGKDNPVSIEDIFEMIGYTLTMNVDLRKAFFIYGDTRAGKTQFQNVLQYIVGKDNRASTDLKRMAKNEFGTDNLPYKILNMIGDLSDASLDDVSIFKQLAGGDLYIPAELKGGKKFQFRNMVKIWYNANVIPSIADLSDNAFYNRWILVYFPNYFPDKEEESEGEIEAIPAIYKSIVENSDEVQGIIKNAIAGAYKLMERGAFRKIITENTKHIWKYNSDVMYAFLYDSCNKNRTDSISALEFHNAFNQYTYDNNRGTYTPYIIKRMSEKNGVYKLRSGSEDEWGKRAEYYMGIGWKDEEEQKTRKLVPEL